MTLSPYPAQGWPKARRILGRTVMYAFLSVASFIMIYPMLYGFLGAFTTGDRFMEANFLPIPNTLNLDYFVRGFKALQGAYLVTGLRAGFYMGMSVLTGMIGGYVFSKLRFPGRNQVFLIMLLGMVMPAILMIVPQYLQMAWWPLAGGNNWLGQGGHGFIGEWPVLFAYGWVPPFAIFLYKQTYDMLPTEYQEAARLDGAGTLTIVWQVYGPLLRPVTAAIAAITFLAVWNDYLWPFLTIAGNEAWYPITYRVQTFTLRFWSPAGGPNYPPVLVQYLMAMWPPALVYFIFQRYFVQGLVATGLKG
jgi:multiple sugar transport system permease protein